MQSTCIYGIHRQTQYRHQNNSPETTPQTQPHHLTSPILQIPPQTLLENTDTKLYWHLTLRKDRIAAHNRPDITLIHKKQKITLLWDVSTPNDIKSNKKKQKRRRSTFLWPRTLNKHGKKTELRSYHYECLPYTSEHSDSPHTYTPSHKKPSYSRPANSKKISHPALDCDLDNYLAIFGKMKNCEKLVMCNTETRKAHVEKQNRFIQKKQKTPEPSILSSSVFSHDISLNSLSLKSESEDLKENTFRNFSSRSKKPSEFYYECLTSKFSDKDQKILKLMAMRRETKMEETELALIAKNIWEEERLQQEKEAEKRRESLKVHLARKKQIEELENTIRRNHYNENLRQEKMILEMKISEKHEKVERRQKELYLQKKLKPEIHTTRYQLQFHQELKKQKEKEREMEKALHIQEFEAKEKKSQEKLKIILTEKCRKLKEESLKQYLRWQAAKNARDEINKKYEEERIRQLKYSEKNQLLRKERVNWAKEWRRKIILEKNEREKQQHAINYDRVKEEEKERLNRTRRRIMAKDFKMKALRDKREEAVFKSRYNARMTANLREKMRQTFDL